MILILVEWGECLAALLIWNNCKKRLLYGVRGVQSPRIFRDLKIYSRLSLHSKLNVQRSHFMICRRDHDNVLHGFYFFHFLYFTCMNKYSVVPPLVPHRCDLFTPSSVYFTWWNIQLFVAKCFIDVNSVPPFLFVIFKHFQRRFQGVKNSKSFLILLI